jgi:hypothetical protein
MPIHFECPHCGVASDFNDKCAGHTGPCASCGEPITIPSPDGFEPARYTSRGAILVVILVIGIIGAGFAAVLRSLPSSNPNDPATLRLECGNRLKQIASAMHAYAADNGRFPPAYVADKQGKRLYSWRALLLPYLDKDLAKQFHYDQPWNSPDNNAVANLTIGLFQCPAQQPPSREPTTNYMMVVGSHTISDGPHSRKLADITDGLGDTIMLVEVADSSFWWAEPEDLSFDQINFKINNSRRLGISSCHPGGVNAAFCGEHADKQGGVVRFLKDDMNPQLVKAMLTIDGAENPHAGH